MQVDLLEFHIKGIMSYAGGPISKTVCEYLCPCNTDRIARLVARLDALRDLKRPTGSKRKQKEWTGKKSNLIGKAFERLVAELFVSSQISTQRTNVNTTTNEIDLLLTLMPLSHLVPPFQGLSHVHGESKCFERAPKSEWIGEMSQNAVNAGTRLAILFLFCNPRKLDSSIRANIGITAANGAVVVPFGRAQLNQIISGDPVLHVLIQQHSDARNMLASLYV